MTTINRWLGKNASRARAMLRSRLHKQRQLLNFGIGPIQLASTPFHGKFARILERKTVGLSNKEGGEIQVLLSDLSTEDIYEAVKSDLAKTQAANSESASPFKKLDSSKE